jgi:hypothetical protein
MDQKMKLKKQNSQQKAIQSKNELRRWKKLALGN